ncbi:hypothetical protein EOM81_08705 [bacterium]|nr:hypothetical protein [bacterium]
MNTEPWIMNPDLTWEKIKVIADLICTVRSEVIDLHEEDQGDTRLCLGIRAYERARMRIINLANSNVYSWLSILTETGRFTFKIGNTPVRFTRNCPELLPTRKLIVSEEARQFVFDDIYPGYGQSEPIVWFFVVDTPAMVPAETMYLVGYTLNKEIRCQWEIPLEEFVSSGLTLVSNELAQAVEFQPAIISIKKNSHIGQVLNE